MTAYDKELKVASALALAVSSPAVSLTPEQARSWLFGDGPSDPAVTLYLNGVVMLRGFNPFEQESFDSEIFLSFMTPLVGARLANEAALLIEDLFK